MEYLSVSEFSKRSGISRQGIYYAIKYANSTPRGMRKAHEGRLSIAFEMIAGRRCIPVSELHRLERLKANSIDRNEE